MQPETGRQNRLAAVSDIPADRGLRVKHGDTYIALFKVDGKVYAINAICPHAGAFLDMGWIQDHCVICPLHAWDFDVRSGESPTYAVNVDTYPVEVRDGDVYLVQAGG